MPIKKIDGGPGVEYMEVEIIINGGPDNVWHRWDLRCNPFPYVPKYEFARFNRVLQNLDSDPIPDRAALLKIIEGGDPWFVEACTKAYRPGERTRFKVKILTKEL